MGDRGSRANGPGVGGDERVYKVSSFSPRPDQATGIDFQQECLGGHPARCKNSLPSPETQEKRSPAQEVGHALMSLRAIAIYNEDQRRASHSGNFYPAITLPLSVATLIEQNVVELGYLTNRDQGPAVTHYLNSVIERMGLPYSLRYLSPPPGDSPGRTIRVQIRRTSDQP